MSKVKESKTRSVIKGISWRVLGTLDTITISFIVTGSINKALSIGAAEIISKLLLYYLHERIWLIFTKGHAQSRVMSMVKAVIWRMIGTMDTILISFLIITFGPTDAGIDDPFKRASTIGVIELFTKIILFYIHERIWNRIKFGRHELIELQES